MATQEVVLTTRQQRLLEYVALCIDSTGCQPTYREICRHMGYTSTNSVMEIVTQLVTHGVVFQTSRHGMVFDWKRYLKQHGDSQCAMKRTG